MHFASLVSGKVVTLGEPSLQAACEARVGQVVNGKWTLEGLLGVGGMAAVYVAVHKIGRREAIKILHPEVARSQELRARFEQEAQAVNRFAHPGAVEVRDIDVSEDGCPFLVMELLEGENLTQRANRFGGLPREEMLGHVDALLDVLAAAHAQGIIHRDIKLDNLFVTTDGKLKVLDFGIARVTSGPALTKHGARLGTTAYMAPEQVRGEEIDGRTDVFAVGATMFRLVAKRRIHEASSDAELLVKMGREPAPPLASVAPEVDRGLALVVDRALAFQRDERYPNALTMQGDVRALREGEPPPFALAREHAAGPALHGAPDPAAALRAPDPAVASEPTVAEPGRAATSMAAPPPSIGRRQDATMAIPTPPPGSVLTPFASAAPSATPLPSAAAPPPSSAWPAPSVAVPYGGPVSATYGSAAPTPQAFSTPAAVRPKSSGGLAIVIGLVMVLGIGGLAAGIFVMTSSSSSSSSVAGALDEEDDEEPAKKKKSSEKAKPAATADPAPPPSSPPAPTTTPTEEIEEKVDEKAEQEADDEGAPEKAPEKTAPKKEAAEPTAPPAKPTATTKGTSTAARPTVPGTGLEPAPVGKPKPQRPTPIRPK